MRRDNRLLSKARAALYLALKNFNVCAACGAPNCPVGRSPRPGEFEWSYAAGFPRDRESRWVTSCCGCVLHYDARTGLFSYPRSKQP